MQCDARTLPSLRPGDRERERETGSDEVRRGAGVQRQERGHVTWRCQGLQLPTVARPVSRDFGTAHFFGFLATDRCAPKCGSALAAACRGVWLCMGAVAVARTAVA